MAELMDLPLQIEPISSFSEHFTKDGVVDERLKTDPDFSYRPDLLERTDLYVVAMTRLPWREKFLSFIDLYPTRMVYIVKKGVSKPDPSRMDGQTLSILSDSSYETWARANLPLEEMEIINVESGTVQAGLVADGTVDFTLMDANLAFTRLKDFPNLTFYPSSESVDHIGWAVSSDDTELHSLVEKAIQHLNSRQAFHTAWKAYYGIDFEQYLQLVSLEN